MSALTTEEQTLEAEARRRLGRRLLPLTLAVALQGFMLWVPVEKLFMTEIGFDAASIGVMAAAYAALVPLVEIPSGILADRWSRRGVLVVSAVALALTSLVGGLSQNVPTYIGAALVLAVYFAMYSGTMDAIVYDTVLEEIGASLHFEQRIGRVRAVESAALVAGALVGGVVAEVTAPRVAYFVTAPFAVGAVWALLRFREPQLHKSQAAVSLRVQVATTFDAVARSRRLAPIVVLALLTALMLQSVFEFGPLWLVADDASPGLYGPYWAALMATLGVGGLLAGRLPLHRAAVLALVAVVLALASGALLVDSLAVGIAAQVVLALLLLIASIRATQLLHDAVPSAIRTGVASGVSALGWMAFLPFAFTFGLFSREQGVHVAAWMFVAATLATGVALVVVVRGLRPGVAPAEDLTNRLLRDVRRCLVERRQEIEPLDCHEVVELVTEFLEDELDPHAEVRFVNHVRNCLGCSRHLRQVEQTIRELRGLPAEQQLPAQTRAALLASFSASVASR
ncbi:MAG TPA: MFS transporter [Intrasporangium sp.]|nr:MFS transporter [Intrasporangium sp.]